MKFTLAVVSYNASETIKLCLDSCINQSYKDLEIIVVDDNSSDNTLDIIEDYKIKDKRIKLIKHDINRSALQARKTAVKHATSEYIWFIDSDDNIIESAVDEIFSALESNNMPDILTFGSNDYYENGELKRVFYDWGRDNSLIDWKMDSDYRPYTRVMKKAILDKTIEFIPDDLYLYRHNDFFMFNMSKLFVKNKCFLKCPLYNYTLSSSSVTNQKDKQSITRHIEFIDKLLLEYKNASSKIGKTEINIDEFIKKEKDKLMKYAISQYKDNSEAYLHTLKLVYKNNKEIIISLTSYSKRIRTVHQVIRSLLNQSVLCDKILLWLDKDEITFDELPSKLKSLVSDKFEIKFCPNYKSYKKLIPTLNIYPDATIITFDDDVDYPLDQVEKLLLAHFENPTDIIASFARNIHVKNGTLLHYSEWLHTFKEQVGKPYFCLLPIGVGGILYPSGSLHAEVMNIDAFMSLAPHGDDLWFKSMSLMNNRKVISLNHGYNLSKNQIDGTQDVGLWQTLNNGTDSNLIQLNAILNRFPHLKNKIEIDRNDNITVPVDDYVSLINELNKLKKYIKHNENSKTVTINEIFDEEWYKKTYPDVIDSGMSPIEHYNKIGRLLNRNKNKFQ